MRERHNWSQVRGEGGVSLITVMMVLFIMTLMGISILAITGFERQIASSVSVSEASVDAAESCMSTGANVLQQVMQNRLVPAALLTTAVPPGPIPVAKQNIFWGEVILDGGDPDVPLNANGTPNAPDLQMTVGNYQVWGDIDRLYGDGHGFPPNTRIDFYYRITCVVQNVATGISSQVDGLYVCHQAGLFCQPRSY